MSPQPARPGERVTIDVAGMSQADAPVNRWKWDLDDNGSYELDTGEVPRASVSYPNPGAYNVGVEHSFDSGSGSGGGSTWHIPEIRSGGALLASQRIMLRRR